MNLPPEPIEADLEGRFARGLAGCNATSAFDRFPSYQQPGGSDTDRGIAADWLRGACRDCARGSPADLPRHADRFVEPAAALDEAGRRVLTDR